MHATSRMALHRLTRAMSGRELPHLVQRLFSSLLDALRRHITRDVCIIPKLTRVVQSDAPKVTPNIREKIQL